MSAIDTTLCILLKAPRPGEVKTRLAASIGAQAAARLAGAFFRDTLALAEDFPSARVVVALSGDESALPFCDVGVPIWPQGEGDLGDRMERVLRLALTETPRAVALGTDSPGLPRPLLDEALRTLDTHDAVLGPADDGGFYLLGLRQCPEGILRGLPWSTRETRARTQTRLLSAGLRVGVVPGWFDVDTAEDLMRLQALLHREEIFAPATRATLADLQLGRVS